METRKYSRTIRVPDRLASTLGEVGRHVADRIDGDVEQPRATALQLLAEGYIDQYSDDFEKKADGQWRYLGDGESNQVADTDTEADDSDGEEDEDRDETVAFSMSEGSPGWE